MGKHPQDKISLIYKGILPIGKRRKETSIPMEATRPRAGKPLPEETDSNPLALQAPQSLLQLLSLPLQHRRSHRQSVNRQEWLCSPGTVSPVMGSGVQLAHGAAVCRVLQQAFCNLFTAVFQTHLEASRYIQKQVRYVQDVRPTCGARIERGQHTKSTVK